MDILNVLEQIAKLPVKTLIELHNEANKSFNISRFDEETVNSMTDNPWLAIQMFQDSKLKEGDYFWILPNSEIKKINIDDPANPKIPINLTELANNLTQNKKLAEKYSIQIETQLS